MSISVGTNVGPVRVSKRLGGKPQMPASQATGVLVEAGLQTVVAGAKSLPFVVEAVLWVIALVIAGYWAVLATGLALAFSFLAAIGFGLSKFVPGTHTWGMRFSRCARWSWLSIGRVFAKVRVQK